MQPVAIRPVSLPGDLAALRALDTSFSTDAVYDVEPSDLSFRLVVRQLPAEIRSGGDALAADLADASRPWTDAWVSVTADEVVVGFAATSYESWNRRLRLWHLYVSPEHRQRGIGRSLVEHVAAHAPAVGAVQLFLETSSPNLPAVAFYRRLGFQLVGLDLSLYDGTPAATETALFLSRKFVTPSL